MDPLPFNNARHQPSRPEIDTMLGILPAIELKRFEKQLDMMDSRISWAMQWYDAEQAWGYRASFRQRVLCILHFHDGFFFATLGIPLAREADFLALKELTPKMREHFAEFTLSPKVKWVKLHVRKPVDTASLLAAVRLKLEILGGKTGSN